jgi:hypothetical protein
MHALNRALTHALSHALSRRLVALMLAGCSLFVAAGGAFAADDSLAAPIGRSLVVLPVPPGFVEPSRTVPPLRVMGERMTPPSNRLLALFIAEGDERDAREGRNPAMVRYYMAQTLRQTEEQALVSADFGEVKTMLRQQYQQLLSNVAGAAQGHLDNAMREMGRDAGQDAPSLKIGELRGLEVFDERAGSISLLAMTKLAIQQAGGQVLEMPVAMSITTARVKDKLVYFYAYSQYRDKADLDWLRATTRDWLPRLAAAN